MLGSLLPDVLILLGGSVVALLPVYAADILEVGPQGLGLMPAIGAVLVGLYLSRYKNDFTQAGHTLFRALLIFAVSVLGFALADSLWLACAGGSGRSIPCLSLHLISWAISGQARWLLHWGRLMQHLSGPAPRLL